MTTRSMSTTAPSTATSSGLRKKFKVADDDFDAIETLYGVGYRYRES